MITRKAIEAYVRLCKNTPDPLGSVALLPFALGLRATEVLTLSRGKVQKAADTGLLDVIGKGNKPAELPAHNCKRLFKNLLPCKAFRTGAEWQLVGQSISGSDKPQSVYCALWRLVKGLGAEAGSSASSTHHRRTPGSCAVTKRVPTLDPPPGSAAGRYQSALPLFSVEKRKHDPIGSRSSMLKNPHS